MVRAKPQIAIFDGTLSNHIDALQVALLRAGRDTLLPELYEIFGRENLLKFLDIFCGTTIVVPPRKVLDDAIRDTHIFISIDTIQANRGKLPKERVKNKTLDVVKDLAIRYDVDRRTVWSIYKEMKKFYP